MWISMSLYPLMPPEDDFRYEWCSRRALSGLNKSKKRKSKRCMKEAPPLPPSLSSLDTVPSLIWSKHLKKGSHTIITLLFEIRAPQSVMHTNHLFSRSLFWVKPFLFMLVLWLCFFLMLRPQCFGQMFGIWPYSPQLLIRTLPKKVVRILVFLCKAIA